MLKLRGLIGPIYVLNHTVEALYYCLNRPYGEALCFKNINSTEVEKTKGLYTMSVLYIIGRGKYPKPIPNLKSKTGGEIKYLGKRAAAENGPEKVWAYYSLQPIKL